jgi:hypothetical protein
MLASPDSKQTHVRQRFGTSPSSSSLEVPAAAAPRPGDQISKNVVGPLGMPRATIGASVLPQDEVSSAIRGVSCTIFLALVCIGAGIGIVMGSVVWFRSHEGQLHTLYWKDLSLKEALFTEKTARTNKDMIMMQEQARQEEAFAENVATRIAEQTYINVTLQTDIAEREGNNTVLSELLDNETAARIAGDQALQDRINNATADMDVIKAFQNYSIDKFMTLMQNISDLQTALQQDITDRNTAIMTIMAQRTAVDTALVNLVNALNAEIQARIDKDNLLQELINQATFSIIRSINDQQPINFIMYLVSTNDLYLTVTNGTMINEVVINNLGIYTFNGIVHSDNSTHELFFTADHGFGITNDPLNHEITIFSLFDEGGQVPNFVRLSATFPYGTDQAGFLQFNTHTQQGNIPGMAGPQIDDPSSFPLGNGMLLAHPLTNPGKGILYFPGSSMVKLRYGASGICNANDGPCQCAGPGCPVSYYPTTLTTSWHCQDTPAGNKCTAYCTMFNIITFQDLSLFGTIQCASRYGFGWYCAISTVSEFGFGECTTAGFSIPCSGPVCENNGDLGNQWGCLPEAINNAQFVCDQLYCYYDSDCINRLETYGYRNFCVNGRCVPSYRFNGDDYPQVYPGAWPTYNTLEKNLPAPAYVAGYPGYASAATSLNTVRPVYNYDGIISNKPLFTILGGWPFNVNQTCDYTHECPPYAICEGNVCKRGHFPSWDGQNNGFRIPVAPIEESTWVIKVTVTIRALFSQQHVNQNSFVALYIDRGFGWEKQDETFVGASNSGYTIAGPLGFPSFFTDAFFYSPYISLSTVVIMSTTGPKATPPGTPLYVGWSTNTFWLCPITVSGQGCTFQASMNAESLWIPWYRITYEITKLA